MTEATMEVSTDVPASPAVPDMGYQLVAINDEQMKVAHGRMIEWAQAKQAQCDAEGEEEGANLAIAIDQGWKRDTFKRRIKQLERRRIFYKKVEEALLAGYVIVPNFQMDIFAIRTNQTRVPHEQRVGHYNRFTDQPAQILPQGEGEYKNPTPSVHHGQRYEGDGKGGTTAVATQYLDDEFSDIAFPFALAKPTLMQKTAQAMAGKLFDEIGVAVDTQWRGGRGGDPIVLGRIRNPRNASDITFFIGWYFDPTNI